MGLAIKRNALMRPMVVTQAPARVFAPPDHRVRRGCINRDGAGAIRYFATASESAGAAPPLARPRSTRPATPIRRRVYKKLSLSGFHHKRIDLQQDFANGGISIYGS